MDKDTLYWILSTLPQVIGALTGLLIAGITFLFQSLDKEMEKDESSIPAIMEIKKQTYIKTKYLLISSILAILVDVILLGVTPWFSNQLDSLYWLNWIESTIAIGLCLIATFLNVSSFVMLYTILKEILNPEYQQKVNNSLAEKENENISNNNSVSPQDFLEYFIKFERTIRDFFPHSMQRNPLRSMVNQLVGDNIISRDDVARIQSIINKRNIFAHGGDIGRVDNDIIYFLSELIAQLEAKLEPYLANRRRSRMEETFEIWIARYVDNFEEAEQLDHAVRYETDYGIYHIMLDNERIFVRVNDGKPLYLNGDNAKRLFLNILESKYSIGDNMSIEDSASYKHAIEKDD